MLKSILMTMAIVILATATIASATNGFAVCLSFLDEDENYVGNVLAVLSIPGEKDWKVLSSPTEILAGGCYPCNAHFRRWAFNVGGTYSFKFHAPEGWEFVSSDEWEIDVIAGQDFYSICDNYFHLKKVDDSGEEPPEDPVIDPGTIPDPPPDLPPSALYVVEGTKTHPGEGWDNLIDGDLEGWDGTTTICQSGDCENPPYVILGFGENALHKFAQVYFQTDNGSDDDKWELRQYCCIELLASTTGIADEDFESACMLNLNPGLMEQYKICKLISARFIKLQMIWPNFCCQHYGQLVEFAPKLEALYDEPASDGAPTLCTLPEEYSLSANYPNPFNPTTMIEYNVPEEAQVTLMIYDTNGRVVETLVNAVQNAGSHSVQWNAEMHPNGVYFYRLQAGSFSAMRKMTLVK